MSHLYNTLSYQTYLLHNHGAIKKFVDARLDQVTDKVQTDVHPFELQEEPMVDDTNVSVYYNDESFPMNKAITKLDCLSEILTEQCIRELFTHEELQ